MTNKGNQIRNKMIRSHEKTDLSKLIELKRHIFLQYPGHWCVYIEPYLVFTKGEDRYLNWSPALSEWAVTHRHVHRTDLLIITSEQMVLVELDGPIHDIKTEKTIQRNKRYELNHIPYIVINEAELKEKLGIPKTRPLTQEQINSEFDERLAKI